MTCLLGLSIICYCLQQKDEGNEGKGILHHLVAHDFVPGGQLILIALVPSLLLKVLD